MLPGENDSFPDVVWRSRINADYRHAPLLARNAKGGVEVAGLDRAVGKHERLPVGVFGGPGLIGPPDTVEPASVDISAVPRGRIITGCGWGDRVDQRPREL